MDRRKTFLINFAYFGVLLLLAIVVLRYALPMTAPFVAGFMIAYCLQRPIRFMQVQGGMPGKLTAILTVVVFYATVGAFVAVLSIYAASGVVMLVSNLPHIYVTHVQPFLIDILKNVEGLLQGLNPVLVEALDTVGMQMLEAVEGMIASASVWVMGLATDVATAVPGLFIKLVLMVISSFFIAADYDQLTGFCLRQMNGQTKEVFLQIKEYVVGTLLVCIRSYALIMSITFVELSIGLTLAGIKHPVLVAFIIALFDILPVLGTGGIMIPWTILTAIQGNGPMALKLLAIYVVITVIRNIIEPKIVGGQLGLHPVVTLCSLFVGVQLFGVVGLFGFPIGLSLLCYLDAHGVIRLFRKREDDAGV